MAGGLVCGKIALITGAGSGIGRAACAILAREGALVVATDRNPTTAQETLEIIKKTLGEANGKDHLSLALDVSQADSVKEAMERVGQHFSAPPSIIVNSAGITKDNFILKLDEFSFQQVIDINLKGTFLVMQAAAQAMVDASIREGSIVNLASIVGKIGNIGQCNYSASKAGVEALTKTAAKEFGKFGIRCNAIVPGFIHSPMTDAIPDKVKDKFRVLISLGRFGLPEEVAEVIAFLASDKSSFVNGASIEVTGGF